jgi:1-pyrroline-5-carboxylate dehydrogenase
MWETIGKNMTNYKSYPRIVGETGGKDFVVAHKSADPDVVATALLRGAFEFQDKNVPQHPEHTFHQIWRKR